MEILHTVAFAAAPGGGNPCPVVLHADGMSKEDMMAVAQRFGCECVCVLASALPDCQWQVRYFTPAAELTSCGHATIAVVTVLVKRGMLTGGKATLETAGSPLPITWEMQGEDIIVQMEQGAPALGQTADRAEVCRALGITPDDLGDAPLQAASTSRFKLIVPLKSRAVLDGLQPDFEALWALCDHTGTSGLYPYAPGDCAGEVYARQYPNRTGYLEDPATGVAASALNGYFLLNGCFGDCPADGWHSTTVYQGQAMGRPSVLLAEVYTENGKALFTRIGGKADITDGADVNLA